jgi:hypothetical protein
MAVEDKENVAKAMNEVEIGVDAQRRAQNCIIDIKNALERYQCVIEPIIQITGNGITKGSYMVIPLVKRPIG